MKLIRTFSIFITLLAIILINFNCSDTDFNTPVKNEVYQTDGPTNQAGMIVYEKVSIAPPDNDPYETYITLGTYNCLNIFEGAGNLCINTLNTPPAYRVNELGEEITHISYKVERGYRFICGDLNSNVVWEIGSIFVYNMGVAALGTLCESSIGCDPGEYCGTNTIINDPVSLQPNTQYTVKYGGIRFQDDE